MKFSTDKEFLKQPCIISIISIFLFLLTCSIAFIFLEANREYELLLTPLGFSIFLKLYDFPLKLIAAFAALITILLYIYRSEQDRQLLQFTLVQFNKSMYNEEYESFCSRATSIYEREMNFKFRDNVDNRELFKVIHPANQLYEFKVENRLLDALTAVQRALFEASNFFELKDVKVMDILTDCSNEEAFNDFGRMSNRLFLETIGAISRVDYITNKFIGTNEFYETPVLKNTKFTVYQDLKNYKKVADFIGLVERLEFFLLSYDCFISNSLDHSINKSNLTSIFDIESLKLRFSWIYAR